MKNKDLLVLAGAVVIIGGAYWAWVEYSPPKKRVINNDINKVYRPLVTPEELQRYEYLKARVEGN